MSPVVKNAADFSLTLENGCLGFMSIFTCKQQNIVQAQYSLLRILPLK
jgi:hypothetical protein